MEIKLIESNVPQLFSQAARTYAIDWAASDTKDIIECFVTGFSRFLGIVKSKEEKSCAVAINDLKGNMRFAAIVRYHENEEDPERPGNWSYEMTFNPEDIKDVVNVYVTTDVRFVKVLQEVTYNLKFIKYNSVAMIEELLQSFVDSITEFLDSNAKQDEAVDLVFDGFFTASVAVEDGEKVMGIVPDGAMKRLIKDDSSLEN